MTYKKSKKALLKRIETLEEDLEQERKLKKYYQKKADIKENMGFKTLFDRDLSTLRKDLFEEPNYERAEQMLDAISLLLDIKGKGSFFLAIDRKNKTDYTPIYPVESQRKGLLSLIKVMRYEVPELAKVPYEVHQTLEKESKKDNYNINLTEPRLIGKYLISDRIFGSRIDEFYRKLITRNSNPITKERIVEAVIKKILKDNAYSITRKYDLSVENKIPSHKEKAFEILKKANEIELIMFSSQNEQRIAGWFEILDKATTHPVRDGTPFNYIIQEEHAKILLSDVFLQTEQPFSTIESMVEQGVFAYDLDDMYMTSFPLDEFVRATDFLMPALPYTQTLEFKDYFIERFHNFGGSGKDYDNQQVTGRVFRNLRMAIVCQIDKNYSACEFINTTHCLQMATRTLLQRDLTAKEKEQVSFNNAFHLMMQTYC